MMQMSNHKYHMQSNHRDAIDVMPTSIHSVHPPIPHPRHQHLVLHLVVVHIHQFNITIVLYAVQTPPLKFRRNIYPMVHLI